jgi:hypothetical protein
LGHPSAPAIRVSSTPKLSVRIHAGDAPNYLDGLDHVVIVWGSTAEGESHSVQERCF